MDNIFHSLLTIFVFSSLEDWNYITYSFIDSNSEEVGPIYDNRMWMMLYSFLIVYICSFILQNLLIGIVYLNYSIAKKDKGCSVMTTQLKCYIDIQRRIVNADPLYHIYKVPDNPFRRILYKIINYRGYFESLMLLATLASIVIMALESEDMSIKK
jgi:hypothetical protein